MQANPDELLENSRDALRRARKYMDEAKGLAESSEDRKILEARAEELIYEAQRWTKMAKNVVAS